MRSFLAIMTFVAVSSAGLSHAAIIRGPGAPPNPVTTISHTSDVAETVGKNRQATNAINLAAGQDMLKLTFWGKYEGTATAPTDAFTLQIWGPPSTAPGPLTNSDPTNFPLIYNSRISVARTEYYTGTGTNKWWQYVADFSSSPIPFTKDGNYFISVVNSTTDDNPWAWTSTTNSGSDRYNGSTGADWFLVPNGGNLAFTSEHAPEPGSIAVLTISSVGLGFGAWRRRRKQKATPA